MTDILMIFPIIIVLIYGLVSVQKKPKLNLFIIGAILLSVDVSLYFFLGHDISYSQRLVIILVFTILSFFFLLRLENKITLPFLFLFLLSIALITYLGLKYPELDLYMMYLLMGVFLLAENNQIFMRKTYEESATEYQNKILDKQVEEVKNIYMTMRGWRHDYHNHLQKLKAHISMNQIAEAKSYLNELEIDLDQVNQLVESGNINLDAILNSKISYALNNQIEMNFKANVPQKLTISDIDLCVLIGNLIDNAVEACEKIKEGHPKFIRIYIGVFKKQLYISISNATNELIKKLDEEYITTKRGNHGHGLKRINHIVSKYGGYINRQNEPGVFVSEVLLPL